MTIREELAEAISDWRKNKQLTYGQMIEETGLNKTQLIRVIKQKGEGVSIDLMEKVCEKLGYKLTFCMFLEEDNKGFYIRKPLTEL